MAAITVVACPQEGGAGAIRLFECAGQRESRCASFDVNDCLAAAVSDGPVLIKCRQDQSLDIIVST